MIYEIIDKLIAQPQKPSVPHGAGDVFTGSPVNVLFMQIQKRSFKSSMQEQTKPLELPVQQSSYT